MYAHNEPDSPRIPIRSAVEIILQQMAETGYCEDVVKYYRYSYRRILAFAERRNATTYSSEFGNDYLEAFAKEIAVRSARTKTLMWKARRAVQRLHDFTVYNRWYVRPIGVPEPDVPEPFVEAFAAFVEYWETERKVAAGTLAYSKKHIPLFLRFLAGRGVHRWDALHPAMFSEFCALFTNWSPGALDLLSSHLRLFMRFLLMRGIVDKDWRPKVPRFRPFAGQRLPSVLPSDTVMSILDAVDRSTVQGRRDYAIMLLAGRLGLRIGDIRVLRLEHLKWDESRIEFVQSKSGRLVSLPMMEEVGSALIDYIKNGRPNTRYREIFLRLQAPCEPLKSAQFYNQLAKYRQRAGITLKDGTKRGIHAFRHTLASDLLSAEVPLETIADILGHASLNNTRIYTRVDLIHLRAAALEVVEAQNA